MASQPRATPAELNAVYTKISKVPKEALSALANVLSMAPAQLDPKTGKPSAEWLASQASKVAELPGCLLVPKDFLKGLQIKAAEFTKAAGMSEETPTVLCKAHKALNPRLIRQVFAHVAREVGAHADRIREHGGDMADDAVRAWGDRLFGVSALWIPPETFRFIVGKHFPQQMALPHLRRTCEACILAAIGARAQTLSDLRAAIISRHTCELHEARARDERRAARCAEQGRPRPRHLEVDRVARPVVWHMVNSWVGAFGGPNAMVLRGESNELGEKLAEIRIYERKLRRATERQLRAQGHRGWPKDGEKPARMKTRRGHYMPRARPDLSDDESPPSSPRRGMPSMQLPVPVMPQQIEEGLERVSGFFESYTTPLIRPKGSPLPEMQATYHPRPDDFSVNPLGVNPFDYHDEYSYDEDSADDSDKDLGDGDDNANNPFGDKVQAPRKWYDDEDWHQAPVPTPPPAEASSPHFRHESAMPAPLNIKKARHQSYARTTINDNDSWVSESVHTWVDKIDEEDKPQATPVSNMSRYANLSARSSKVPTRGPTPAATSSMYSADGDDAPPRPVSPLSDKDGCATPRGPRPESETLPAHGYAQLQAELAAGMAAPSTSALSAAITEANDIAIVPEDSISCVAERRGTAGQAKFRRVEAEVREDHGGVRTRNARGPPPAAMDNEELAKAMERVALENVRKNVANFSENKVSRASAATTAWNDFYR
jgi:hypothetical protein